MEELKRAPAVDLEAAARAIEAFLTALGHPPQRDPQLGNTGALVARAFHDELLAGHRMDPAEILAESVAADRSELVLVRDLDVTCVCPHHLLPASGVLHVAYVPAGRVVGLGALARLAQCFARRLILQERLCEGVVHALMTHTGARGAACIAELAPSCLTTRGQRPARARVVTVSAGGCLDEPSRRAELFALCAAPHPDPR